MWDTCVVLFSDLIACRHHSHDRKLLHLHLCDAHCGQQTDLRRAHVCAFGQHAFTTLNVMTDGPATHATDAHSQTHLRHISVISQRCSQTLTWCLDLDGLEPEFAPQVLLCPKIYQILCLFRWFTLIWNINTHFYRIHNNYTLKMINSLQIEDRRVTYVLRFSQQFCVLHLNHCIRPAWDGSTCCYPHHLTRHHGVCGLKHTNTHTSWAILSSTAVKMIRQSS